MGYGGERKLLNIIERPVQNIKNIDWAVLGLSLFTMALICLWIIPVEIISGVKFSIGFLFSPEFYELKEISNDPFEPKLLIQQQNNLYQMFNIGKIIVWVMTPIMLLLFLFKKPGDSK